jgi:NOL1/NOP2/fmu family ribosome biogenesis protein
MKRVPFAEIDGTPYREWWRDRFAPDPDPLAALRFFRRGRNSVWVGSADVAGLASTRLDAVGLHLLRIGRRIWKPTSAAIVAFGDAAQTNFIELTRAEALAFLAGETLVPAHDDPRRVGLTRGFTAVRYGGVGLGCGEWHGEGVLHSLIPTSQRVAGLEV